MKITLSTLTLTTVMIFAMSVLAHDKVVVVPLGSKVRTVQQTFTLNLPSSAFIPGVFQTGDPKIYFNVGNFAYLTQGDLIGGLGAPINLQDGAVITNTTCYMYDNSTENFTSPNSKFFLWRQGTSSADYEQITPTTSCSTSGASVTIQDFSVPSITYPNIDNSQYFYGAYVLLKISAQDPLIHQLRFYGCRITYTLDVVVP